MIFFLQILSVKQSEQKMEFSHFWGQTRLLDWTLEKWISQNMRPLPYFDCDSIWALAQVSHQGQPKVQPTPQWLLFLIGLGWTVVRLIRLLNITRSAKPLTKACALYVIVLLMNGIAAWTIHSLFCLNISDLIWCSCGLWGQALL